MLKSPAVFLASVGFLVWNPPAATAQHLKYGVSAGQVRSFVYPQNFSTNARYDYVHAEGQWGYELRGHAERPLGPKTAVDAASARIWP